MKIICVFAFIFVLVFELNAQDTLSDFAMDHHLDDGGIQHSKNVVYFNTISPVLGKWGLSYERSLTTWFAFEPEVALLFPYNFDLKYINRRDKQYEPAVGWSYSFSAKFIINNPFAKIHVGLMHQQQFYRKNQVTDKFKEFAYAFGVTKPLFGRVVWGVEMGMGLRYGNLQTENKQTTDVILPMSYKIGLIF